MSTLDIALAQESAAESNNNTASGQVLDAFGQKALGVKMSVATPALGRVQIQTTGKIEAIPTREFVQHSMVSGNVAALTVAPGQFVRTGQSLLVIDSPELNQMVSETLQTKEQLQSEIKQQSVTSESEVAQAKTQLELAQSNYDRDRILLEKGIASQKEMQTSNAELGVAKSRFEAALRHKAIALESLKTKLRLSLESLSLKLRQIGLSESEVQSVLQRKQTIATISIKSAHSGVVTDILTGPGQSVTPNVPLVKISDLSTVWATADIYEQDIAKVRLGQPVVVRVSAFPDRTFQGRLTFVGTHLNAQSRTLPVRIEIGNPHLDLTPDMFADLSIGTGQQAASSVLVPKEAVVERDGKQYVFTSDSGKLKPLQVQVGKSFGDNIEITNGLSVGDRIVSQGAFQLNAEGNSSAAGVLDTDDQPQAAKISGSGAPLWLAMAMFIVFLLGFGLSAMIASRKKSGTVPGQIAQESESEVISLEK